jgi:thiosulfate dehydrogenase [quinone] large subunit
MQNGQLAYGLLRITLGINMLMHGVVRIIGGVDMFAAALVKQFVGTPLPEWSVRAFAMPLPYIELVIGLLLLLGLWTKGALLAGAVLMIPLVFGSSLRSDWNTVALQMFYSFMYCVLLARHADDAIRVTGFLDSRKASSAP